MANRQPQAQAVEETASTGKQQDQPLSFKTASKLTSSPRNKHPIARHWGVGSSASFKQGTVQQRTSNPSNDPPMMQRWLGESARDQPYDNVRAFYSVGGKRS